MLLPSLPELGDSVHAGLEGLLVGGVDQLGGQIQQDGADAGRKKALGPRTCRGGLDSASLRKRESAKYSEIKLMPPPAVPDPIN